MGKIRSIVRIAAVAAPAALKLLQTYGPQLKKLASENPEVIDVIKNRMKTITSRTSSTSSPHAIYGHIGVLRDQVTYLYASANTPEVAKQATAWRNELQALENLLPVINTMSKPAQKTELKSLQKRIDILSSNILAATIGDDIEDAQTL